MSLFKRIFKRKRQGVGKRKKQCRKIKLDIIQTESKLKKRLRQQGHHIRSGHNDKAEAMREDIMALVDKNVALAKRKKELIRQKRCPCLNE